MTQVKLTTNFGDIVLELNADKAPITVANFVEYVKAGHYENTVFHRVIGNFMIQGGGFEPGMNCLLYTSPSPRDGLLSRMPSSA